MSDEWAGRAGGLWSSARGNGPHFVLLHPGGTDSRALAPLAEELAGRYRVITPD